MCKFWNDLRIVRVLKNVIPILGIVLFLVILFTPLLKIIPIIISSILIMLFIFLSVFYSSRYENLVRDKKAEPCQWLLINILAKNQEEDGLVYGDIMKKFFDFCDPISYFNPDFKIRFSSEALRYSDGELGVLKEKGLVTKVGTKYKVTQKAQDELPNKIQMLKDYTQLEEI